MIQSSTKYYLNYLNYLTADDNGVYSDAGRYYFTNEQRYILTRYYLASLKFHQSALEYINQPYIIFEHEQLWMEQLNGFGFTTKLMYETIKDELIYAVTKPKLTTIHRHIHAQHTAYIKSLRTFGYMGQKHHYVLLVNALFYYDCLVSKYM